MALAQLPITVDTDPDFTQLISLFACVESIRSWFNVFIKVLPSSYIGFPFSIFSQLMHCLTII